MSVPDRFNAAPKREVVQVLLVEDSLVLAERIVQLLRELPGIELVAVVGTEKAAIDSLKRTPVDLILLDLHLKQGTGFGVLRAMRDLHAKPRTIVFTNYDAPEYEKAALALGATLFLDKARDYPRLPRIIQDLATRQDSVGRAY